MPKFILSPRAKKDLEHIARYTLQQWGVEQRNKYLFAIEKRFHWLVDNAYTGIKRDDIKAGYYSFPHESHMIYYTISENGDVNIIGLLGAGQDLDKYFH